MGAYKELKDGTGVSSIWALRNEGWHISHEHYIVATVWRFWCLHAAQHSKFSFSSGPWLLYFASHDFQHLLGLSHGSFFFFSHGEQGSNDYRRGKFQCHFFFYEYPRCKTIRIWYDTVVSFFFFFPLDNCIFYSLLPRQFCQKYLPLALWRGHTFVGRANSHTSFHGCGSLLFCGGRVLVEDVHRWLGGGGFVYLRERKEGMSMNAHA